MDTNLFVNRNRRFLIAALFTMVLLLSIYSICWLYLLISILLLLSVFSSPARRFFLNTVNAVVIVLLLLSLRYRWLQGTAVSETELIHYNAVFYILLTILFVAVTSMHYTFVRDGIESFVYESGFWEKEKKAAATGLRVYSALMSVLFIAVVLVLFVIWKGGYLRPFFNLFPSLWKAYAVIDVLYVVFLVASGGTAVSVIWIVSGPLKIKSAALYGALLLLGCIPVLYILRNEAQFYQPLLTKGILAIGAGYPDYTGYPEEVKNWAPEFETKVTSVGTWEDNIIIFKYVYSGYIKGGNISGIEIASSKEFIYRKVYDVEGENIPGCWDKGKKNIFRPRHSIKPGSIFIVEYGDEVKPEDYMSENTSLLVESRTFTIDSRLYVEAYLTGYEPYKLSFPYGCQYDPAASLATEISFPSGIFYGSAPPPNRVLKDNLGRDYLYYNPSGMEYTVYTVKKFAATPLLRHLIPSYSLPDIVIITFMGVVFIISEWGIIKILETSITKIKAKKRKKEVPKGWHTRKP